MNHCSPLKLILSLSISFSFSLHADQSAQESTVKMFSEISKDAKNWGESSTPPCPETGLTSSIRPKARPIPSRMPPLDKAFTGKGANCSAFISSNGALGPLGQTIFNNISSRGANSPFVVADRPGMSDGPKACPRWRQLTKQDRIHFWIWTFAAIAWDESTCLPNARNSNATNGVAVGLMQLDEQKSGRSWRGPNCKAKSVASANQNVLCSLDIMEELMRGKDGVYKSNGHLWGSTSYWQKLKVKDGGNIGKLIRTFPLCHEAP